MKLSFYLTLKRNSHLLVFDNATGNGSDNSVDATAANVNPKNYLTDKVSSFSRVLLPVAGIVLIIVMTVYYFKLIKKS